MTKTYCDLCGQECATLDEYDECGRRNEVWDVIEFEIKADSKVLTGRLRLDFEEFEERADVCLKCILDHLANRLKDSPKEEPGKKEES